MGGFKIPETFSFKPPPGSCNADKANNNTGGSSGNGGGGGSAPMNCTLNCEKKGADSSSSGSGGADAGASKPAPKCEDKKPSCKSGPSIDLTPRRGTIPSVPCGFNEECGKKKDNDKGGECSNSKKDCNSEKKNSCEPNHNIGCVCENAMGGGRGGNSNCQPNTSCSVQPLRMVGLSSIYLLLTFIALSK